MTRRQRTIFAWYGIITAAIAITLFVIGKSIHSPGLISLSVAMFVMATITVPLLVQLSAAQSARNARRDERWGKWDKDHPQPSDEYKQAMRDLG